MINFQNVLAKEKAAWHVTARRKVSVEFNGERRRVRERRLRAGERDLLIWQWYWVNGNHLDSPYAVKFHEAIDKLTVGRRRGAGVVVYTPMVDSVGSARETLRDFSARAIPALDHVLSAAEPISQRTATHH